MSIWQRAQDGSPYVPLHTPAGVFQSLRKSCLLCTLSPQVSGVPHEGSQNTEVILWLSKSMCLFVENQEKGSFHQNWKGYRDDWLKCEAILGIWNFLWKGSNKKRNTNRQITSESERVYLGPFNENTGVNIQGSPDKTSSWPLNGNAPSHREWQEISQLTETRGLQPTLLYPARLSIKMEGQIRSFPDKRSLKEYSSTKPALQEMLKGLL